MLRPATSQPRLRLAGSDSMRSRTLLGALLATAALVAACSIGPPPLTAGGIFTSGSECVPGRLYPTVTAGLWVLDNTGTSPVTVTGVKLSSSRGLAMTRAWLMPPYKSPHGDWDYVGVQAGYPPVHWRTWPDRQAIPGAVIKPGQNLNLVFGLTHTGEQDGHTSGPLVTYTASGNSYTLQEGYGFRIAAHCSNTG
jgi:hypothetical protein